MAFIQDSWFPIQTGIQKNLRWKLVSQFQGSFWNTFGWGWMPWIFPTNIRSFVDKSIENHLLLILRPDNHWLEYNAIIQFALYKFTGKFVLSKWKANFYSGKILLKFAENLLLNRPISSISITLHWKVDSINQLQVERWEQDKHTNILGLTIAIHYPTHYPNRIMNVVLSQWWLIIQTLLTVLNRIICFWLF